MIGTGRVGAVLLLLGMAGSAGAVELRGILQGKRVVRADESPLLIPATLTVPAGASLWLEPGVNVRLGEGACLVVEGELHALGEKRAPIRFEPQVEGQRWGNIKILGDKDLPCYDGDGRYLDDSGGSRLLFCEFRSGGQVVDDQYDGGAVYLNGSAPIIRDCLFLGNKADRGGALVAYNFATPLIESCTFEGNESLLDDGGALYCFFYSDAQILRNFIVQNHSARHAGGLYISVSNPLVKENAFIDNSCVGWGGAIYVSSSSPHILDNALYEATAEDRSTGLVFQTDCRPEVKGNSLQSGGVEVYGLNLAEDLDLSGNWWGTTDEFLVQGKVQQRGRGQDRKLVTAPWRDRPVANLLTQPVEILSLHAMGDRSWADTLAFDLCDQAVARIQIGAVDRNRYALDQTSAEVRVLERPEEALTLIFLETEKASGIFRARLALNRSEEDTPRLDVRVGEHVLFTSTANRELKRHYRVDEARPVVHQLAVLSDPDPTHLVADTLRLGWQYFSLLGVDQQAWQLQVASDSSFTPADRWDSGPRPGAAQLRSLSYQGKPLADGERYFVRLRVQGGGAWSAWKRFVIRSDNAQTTLRLNSLPNVPVLLEPAENALLATLRPPVKAGPVRDREGDPVSYEFQLAQDEFFQHVLAATNPADWREAAWTLERDLEDDGGYWVRVRVSDGFEAGDWSAPRRFYLNPVEEAPAPFDLVGPAGTSADLQPEFSWAAAADPDPLSSVDYTLLLSASEDLREPRRVPVGAGLVLRLKDEFPNRVPLWWAVEAKDNSGRTTRSRAALRLLPDSTPSTPVILFPTGGEEARAVQSPRFTPSQDPWPQDRLVYEIQAVAQGGEFAKPLFHLKNLPGPDLASQTLEAWSESRLLAEDKAHSWRLRALDNHGVASEWSEPASFWYNRSNSAPGPVVLQAPADGSLQRQEPTLSWSPATDPDHSDPAASLSYVVQLSEDANFQGRLLEERLTGRTEWLPAGQVADNSRWFWRVQALDDEGSASGWSTARSFVLNRADEAPTGLAWLEPAEGARLFKLDQIELAWQAATDPDVDARLSYSWQLLAAAQPAQVLAQGQTAETRATAKAALASRTDYLLKVSVKDETGLEASLPARRVSVDSHPSAPLPQMEKDELGLTDLLSWAAAQDPDPADRLSYRVEIQDAAGKALAQAPGLTATQLALNRLPGVERLPEDQELRWTVTARDPHGLESTSTAGRFWFNRVNNAPGAPVFAVELGKGGALRTDRPSLAFTPGTDPDHSDPPASLWHELQVAAQPSFQNAATQRVSAGETAVSGLALGDNARWHLRLRCLDDQGSPSPWSAPLVLAVNLKDEPPAVPQLGTPGAGQKLYDLTGVQVAWSACSDPDLDAEVRYRVTLEDGNGTLLQKKETPETALRLTQTLQNDQELRLTVTALDESGLEAASLPLRFTVDSRPGSVSLSGRAGQVLGSADALAWTEAADPDPADRLVYELGWSSTRAFSDGAVKDVPGLRLPLAQLSGLPENGEVWFRVRARDPHGLTGPWSESWNGVWDAVNEAPRWSGRLTPAGGVQSAPVVLGWEAPQDPDRRPQRLQVELNSAADAGFQEAALTQKVDAATASAPLALKENGRRFVRARVVDQDGKSSDWSPVEEYVLNARAEAPGTPGGLTPKDGSQLPQGSVTFRWTEARDPDPGETASHELVLEGPAGERRVPVSGGTASVELEAGVWRWSVLASDPGGQQTRSAVQRLTVQAPPPPPPPVRP